MDSEHVEDEMVQGNEFSKQRNSTHLLTTPLRGGGLLSVELQAARESSSRDLEQQSGASRELLETQYADADESDEREAMQGLNSRKAHKYRRRHHPSKEGKEMRMGISFGAFWNSRGEDETSANLRAYGPGISFYFKWLKWMALVFFLLSLFQVPILIFNLSSAQHFKFSTSPVSSLSIGSLFTEDFFEVNLGTLTNETLSSGLTSSLGPAQLAIREKWLCHLLDLSFGINVTNYCFIDQEQLLVFYASYDSFCMFLFMLMTWLAFAFSIYESRAYQDASQVLKVEDYTISVVIPTQTSLDKVRSHFERIANDEVFEVNIVDTGGKLIEVVRTEDKYRGGLLRMYGLARGIRMRSINEIEREIRLREMVNDAEFANRMRARLELFYRVYLKCSLVTWVKRHAIDWRIKKLRKQLKKIHPQVQKQWLRFVGDTDIFADANSNGEDTVLHRTNSQRRGIHAKHVRAYVTFSNLMSKERVLRLYKRKLFSALWSQKAELQLEGKIPLVVRDPPPPNTLLWENIGYSKTQRRLRAFCAFLAVFVLFMVTAAVSLYVESIQDFLLDVAALPSLTNIGVSIREICDGAFADAGNAAAVEAIVADQPQTLLCLCDQVLLGLVTEEDIQNDLVQPGAVCSEFANVMSEPFLLQIGATIATLVVNSIIFLLLETTTDFMKFPSIVQRELTIMNRIFVLTLINSAGVILLVNADFQLEIDLLLVGNGLYRDFSAGWFETVGLTIVLVAALNIFAPHFYPLLRAFYEKLINNDLVKRGRAFDQTQFNTLMLGPHFRLSIRYAQILTMMFLVLMYSSGMPVLYPIMFLSLVVTYAVDKFMFLKICRTPPAYTTRFGDWSLYMLENAVLLHVIFAIWTYTSPRLFPTTYQESTIAVVEALQQRLQDEAANTLQSLLIAREDPSSITRTVERFSSPQAVPLLCVAGVILLVKILRVFEATRKAARVLRLWVFVYIVKPSAKIWREEVSPRISQSCLAAAEFYESNKDACKPKPITLWNPDEDDEDSEYEASVGFDSSDEDTDSEYSTEFDSDSDTDDDIEEGDAEETIALKRAARERRRAERDARRETRRAAKQKRKAEKKKEKQERRRQHLEAYEKRRADKARRRKEKERKQLERQHFERNKIEEKYKNKEAALQARREKSAEKERRKKEQKEAAQEKLRLKRELKEAALKKKEEAAQAKADTVQAKREAAENERKLKQQVRENKERAKLEAREAKARAKLAAAEEKEAKLRAKVEAREAKIQAKLDAKESKENEIKRKKREAQEAREAKERAKLLAKETKEEERERKRREAEEAKDEKARSKLRAKETKEQEKERKIREAEEARAAKERAKLQAKETKEEERERKKREAEEAKLGRARARREAKETKEQEKERKRREAEEAKERMLREAEEAKEARLRAKVEAKETKEQERDRKRREAEEAKEARLRAKVEAKETKEQEKERKRREAEEEKKRKIREAEEAKEARLRAKIEAKEAKEDVRLRKVREAEEAKEARLRAKIEAKETKEEARLRKIREVEEAKEARLRAKIEAKETKEEERLRKIREAEEAKQAQIQAKIDAKDEKKQQKIDAKEAKERAKVEAYEEKIRIAREAKEAKARAKLEAIEAKERAKIEAKEAKERASVEALEAKERAKLEAKERKERVKREEKEARQRAAEAKIDAKMRAKQGRIEEKLQRKQAKLDAKLEAKQKRIEELKAAKEAKLAAAEAHRIEREVERKERTAATKERAIERRIRNLERYEDMKATCKSFVLWLLTSIRNIMSFFLLTIPVYVIIEPSAWQYRRYKQRQKKLMRLRELRALEEARLAVLRAEDSKLRAENPQPPITMAFEREWIEGYRSYNLKYNPKYVRMLRS